MSFCVRLFQPAAPLAAAPSPVRAGGSRPGAGLVRNLLRGMVCAALAVQMLTGCARSTPQEATLWELSPEAQHTYATLLLDQSIRNDDREGVLEAARLLLTMEDRAQPFVDAAAWLMLNRETSEARKLLEQAVKRVPGDLGLHLLLAETWLEQGDNDQALRILQDFRRNSPDSELVQQELGILYVKTGHFKQADAIFSALPQRLRTSFVRYAHAQALAGLNQPRKAIQQLRLAVQESPEFLDAWFELARLLEADRQYSEANEIYNSLIEQDPDNPDIWIRMVEGQIRAGKPDKALEYAQTGPATYGYRLTAATLFLDAKLYTQAESLLEGLKSDPNAPDEVNFYLAAIAYESHKDVQETLNYLEAIPSENRFYDRALRLRIQLLHDQGHYDDAMQLIQQGQSQFPTERDFRLMEIHLYLLQERYREALTAASAAQAIWPSDDEIAYVYGSVLDSLGRKRDALAVMEEIIARSPEDYQALNYVGYSLAEQGKDLDRAITLLSAALKQAPDHAYILDSLAWAHFRRGEIAEAWKLVSRATSLPDGGDPTIWEHYGDIANAQGLKKEARIGWERALDLDHPNPEIIRNKLNSL